MTPEAAGESGADVWMRTERGGIMTERDFKLIGERLQRFREIRGLSRAVVAHRLGITTEDVEDLETGKTRPRREWIESLREAFALDPGWLLGGKTLDDL